jgi:hypothetical protein
VEQMFLEMHLTPSSDKGVNFFIPFWEDHPTSRPRHPPTALWNSTSYKFLLTYSNSIIRLL